MKSVADNNTAAVENNHPTLLTNTKSSKKKRKNRTKGESQRNAPNKSLETVGKCNTASTVVTHNRNDSNDGIESLNHKLEHNLHISKNGCRNDLVDELKSKKNSKLTNNDNEHKKKNVDSAINGEGGAKRKSNKSLELIQTNGNITDLYHSRHSDTKPKPGLCENEEVTTIDRDNIYCHQITTVDSFETASIKLLSESTDNSSLKISESPLPTTSTDAPATVAIDNNLIDSKNIVIDYKVYESELQMPDIMRLIQAELSEPYSIYTYRYFIYNWPKLCFLAAHGDEYVGAIVCKLDMHRSVRRGYIAMLAVKQEYRKLKIGTTLVEKAVEAMLEDNAEEVVLETERKNIPALRLYENLGFVRDKRLFRYYLNGVDALRLKLWFR